VGLTIHYDWKLRADSSVARQLIQRFWKFAKKLPFDYVSEIYEQDPPDERSGFERYDHAHRRGDIHLSRKRADGLDEVVTVPARHAMFFSTRVHGGETAFIGLAAHPPIVVHREDVIERDKDGSECGRRIDAGDAIEYPTRRRGFYSWHSFCKTQYAGSPKLGGEANFLKAHLSLIELLDQIKACGAQVRIRDDSGYARHRDVNRLLRDLRKWDALIATVVGQFKNAFGDREGAVVAPITERPDFEHLEAKGIAVLRKMASRQRRRRKS
jgi:hypothetical protein